MKQLLQDLTSRRLRVEEVPEPSCLPGGVLVRNVASLVSSGTERASVRLAGKSLAGKAIERPDLVREVLGRLRRDGPAEVVAAVRARLDTDLPLGYSCAGVVLEVSRGAEEFTVGESVACVGAGHASHAQTIWVPRHLCAKVPARVDCEVAASAAVGAIALQGVRLSEAKIGERVAVIGLGLVGLLATQILKAAGCSVWGIDPDPRRVRLARELGADIACENRSWKTALWGQKVQDNEGADAVIVAAAARSSEPIELAGRLTRDRGVVVVVGDVKVDVPRENYYRKELQLRYSRSYGPGRYDPAYEERGIDYPFGYVRWTERRNLEAFLDLVANRKVLVSPLLTHRFPIEQAPEAYRLLSGKTEQHYVGIVLRYDCDSHPAVPPPITHSLSDSSSIRSPVALSLRTVRVGWIGAGLFSRAKLLPQLGKIPGVKFAGVARRFGFQYCSTDAGEILADPSINAVFITTRHDLHARLVIAALDQGKHVFAEKPLCVNEEELARISETYRAAHRLLFTGFNRRFSRFARECAEFFSTRTAPLSILYRVNAGPLPRNHWVRDPEQGHGRIIGEICHFVDLVQFLAGAEPLEVCAWPARSHRDAEDENLHIHLSLADGSQAEITYLSSADLSVPKERLELSAAGRTAICEDFRKWHFHAGGRCRTRRLLRRNKGYREELASFVRAVANGSPSPISFESIQATSLVTFRIRESLLAGKSLHVYTDRTL